MGDPIVRQHSIHHGAKAILLSVVLLFLQGYEAWISFDTNPLYLGESLCSDTFPCHKPALDLQVFPLSSGMSLHTGTKKILACAWCLT